MASTASGARSAVDALLAQAPGGAPESADVERALALVHAKLEANRAEAARLRTRCESGGALQDTAGRSAQLHTLLAMLGSLEQHASGAEKSVGEITAEIRWLDTAKRNVGQSIVTLKRLQMLVRSTFHLEQLCSDGQYREAASTLQAVLALLAFFEPYNNVEYVVEQRQKVHALREKLKTMVMHEYEHTFQTARAHWNARDTVLPDAALMVEALGPDTRTVLLDWYCSRQLREYRRIFRAVDEAGQLDNVSRRYAWIRRVLRTYADEHSAGFLPEWHVDQRVLSLFSEITRDDLKSVLVRQQQQLDADMLLGALNATNEFETQVARQYNRPFAEVVAAHRTAAAVAAPLTITSAFTPYLGVFVDAQERRLAELFAQFARPPGSAPAAGADSFETQVASHADEPMKVLLSSTELFWFYRQTLERCAQLGEHAPFRALGALYAKWLQRYARDVLQPALLQRTPDLLTHCKAVCMALNTADYCTTMCTQLEDKLTEKLRTQDAHAEPFSLEREREAFFGTVAIALQLLSRALYTNTDAAFHQMLRPDPPWTQHVHVDEKSAYVDTLASALEQVGVVVRHELDNMRYVRNWCDKAAAIVVTRFVQTLLRMRPIRQAVAQQLQTDLAHVKTLLLELPHFGGHGAWSGVAHLASVQAAYERHVDKAVRRVAPLLAVLAATADVSPAMQVLVRTYRAEIRDQSLTNFQKVLDLKGVRRLDQNPFVEEFLAAIDREAEPLPTSSALSSLPMDPGAEMYAPPSVGERREVRDEPADEPAGAAGAALVRPDTPTGTGGARLPDWKRFGSMLGAALGREWRP